MNLTKNRNNQVKTFFLYVILFFMFCPLIFGVGTMEAKAETVSEEQKVQNIVDESVFITFTKGENEKYGQFIFGCFYVPDTVYDASLEYGVLVFPKWFAERYGITGNYIEEYTAIGMGDALALIKVDNPTSVSGGKILKCGIINIPDSGEDMELSYIFYVRDTDGHIAYGAPHHAAYATLLAEDYSNDELLEMIGLRVKTESSFKQIVVKITELVNSVWVYVVIAFGSVVVVWGAYIGIRVIIAKKNEEKINANGMIKNLVIGIVVMFVIAVGAPLLINGLSSWLSW